MEATLRRKFFPPYWWAAETNAFNCIFIHSTQPGLISLPHILPNCI